MWPGQQTPEGGENPYRQPGYQQQGQPGPYQQPAVPSHPVGGPLGAPAQPLNHDGNGGADGGTDGGRPSGRNSGKSGKTTTVVAVCAATAVLVAAAVTGVVLLKDDGKGGEGGARADDGKGGPSPSAPASPSGSAGSDAPSGSVAPSAAATVKPTIAGWKAVVNPAHGTAFDVPPTWEVLSPTMFSGIEDDKDPDKALIGHTAPAFYKSKWCSTDGNGDGQIDDFELASTGTKGAEGAKDTNEIAEKMAPTWVFAVYTQPDKTVVKWDKPVEYTTKSGVKGSYVKAHSEGAKKTNKCTSEGQSIVFGFKNSKGDFVAWDFYGKTGVPGAVDDALIMKILSTVRLAGDPTEPSEAP